MIYVLFAFTNLIASWIGWKDTTLYTLLAVQLMIISIACSCYCKRKKPALTPPSPTYDYFVPFLSSVVSFDQNVILPSVQMLVPTFPFEITFRSTPDQCDVNIRTNTHRITKKYSSYFYQLAFARERLEKIRQDFASFKKQDVEKLEKYLSGEHTPFDNLALARMVGCPELISKCSHTFRDIHAVTWCDWLVQQNEIYSFLQEHPNDRHMLFGSQDKGFTYFLPSYQRLFPELVRPTSLTTTLVTNELKPVAEAICMQRKLSYGTLVTPITPDEKDEPVSALSTSEEIIKMFHDITFNVFADSKSVFKQMLISSPILTALLQQDTVDTYPRLIDIHLTSSVHVSSALSCIRAKLNALSISFFEYFDESCQQTIFLTAKIPPLCVHHGTYFKTVWHYISSQHIDIEAYVFCAHTQKLYISTRAYIAHLLGKNLVHVHTPRSEVSKHREKLFFYSRHRFQIDIPGYYPDRVRYKGVRIFRQPLPTSPLQLSDFMTTIPQDVRKYDYGQTWILDDDIKRWKSHAEGTAQSQHFYDSVY